MASVEQTITCTPDDVWRVLTDGWLYPLFVVGASRMRAVDAAWPAVGSKLHHSVGSWPLLLDDTTEVLEIDPGARLKLRARAWPSGAAHVTITVRPEGAATRVRIDEDVQSGPARLVPRLARDLGLRWRNEETLTRLAYLARHREGAS